MACLCMYYKSYGDHRHLHSFPTRRSSDLQGLFAGKNRANGYASTAGKYAATFALASRTYASRDPAFARRLRDRALAADRKSTRLNSSHLVISYAVFCLKKKTTTNKDRIVT